MATDFLDEKRSEIAARLAELKPLVDEYQRLEAAAAALADVPTTNSAPSNGSAPRTASRSRGAHPARKPALAKATTGRRGRPKGTGTRGAEALALVKANPGITIPEIAEKMGIKQNYLYRVLPGLAADDLIVKDGKGWKAKASS